MPPIKSTLEEEIAAYMFRSGISGRGRVHKEATQRMLELLAELVGKGFNTFDLIFRAIWGLKPANHNRSEEHTRLRTYELLQKACLFGLVVKHGRLYELPEAAQG
jgi:hypothetical protein